MKLISQYREVGLKTEKLNAHQSLMRHRMDLLQPESLPDQ